MRKVYLYAIVDENKCIGDQICKNICPSGAISMVENKVHVDPSKCVACFRCAEVCNEEAIDYVPLAESRILDIDPTKVNQDQLTALCRKARLDPEETICMCTLMPAKEAFVVLFMLYPTFTANQEVVNGLSRRIATLGTIAENLENALERAYEKAGTNKAIIFDGCYGSINLSSALDEFLVERAPAVARTVEQELMPKWLKQRGIDPEMV